MDDRHNEDWEYHVRFAATRYEAMIGAIDEGPAMERQAQEDRDRYGRDYMAIKDGEPALRLFDPVRAVRFLVEVCGIPFAVAERNQLSETRTYGIIKPPEDVDAQAREIVKSLITEWPNIFEAVAVARYYNQAFKGMVNASLWNEAVRLIRNEPVAPLDTKPEIWD